MKTYIKTFAHTGSNLQTIIAMVDSEVNAFIERDVKVCAIVTATSVLRDARCVYIVTLWYEIEST